ncbi:MAG: precorrin-6A synthase (deacetylating), partial [Sedimentitalea sp.]
MKELFLIGIGTGNPDHLTFEAAETLRRADLILIPRKGDQKSDLADLRHQICARVLGEQTSRIVEFDLPVRDVTGDYHQGVEDWHDRIALAWQAASGQGQKVALLIWGDPSLYDSSLRIAARLPDAPKITVVAGITSLQMLAAAHAIAINTVGDPFLVTTGRQLRDHGWPAGVDTIAVMLDGGCAFQTLDPESYDIWWGAYLGMPEQILAQGRLRDVSDDIIARRASARA